jgi:sigma-B regulation protein RsbU (phosphoserine phosphatase)
MNAARVLPTGKGEFRTNGRARNYSLPQSSIVASMPPPPSSAPLREEVDSLLREKLDLHSQLFEAAQIQRKLSGPRDFVTGVYSSQARSSRRAFCRGIS